MQIQQIKDYLKAQNLPDFRFRQLLKNYYSGRFKSFDDMSDLPKDLRQELSQKFSLLSVSQDKLLSGLNSQKARLKLADGKCVETVLMDYGDWVTACVSSQVGCPLGCAFCATGQMGFIRNLSSEEIVDQIIFWNQLLFPKYVGRVVFMGMGEPFLNWDNVIDAVSIINDKNALNLGARKISISTAGIVPKIKEFADLGKEINLAISLHAPDQPTRVKLMPIARQYDLQSLKEACLYYVTKTKRQLFFEYALIKGVNDTSSHLQKLVSFLKSHPLFYLNLIPLNQVNGGLTPSLKTSLDLFVSSLELHHLNFSVRQSFGAEINSACGQLVVK